MDDQPARHPRRAVDTPSGRIASYPRLGLAALSGVVGVGISTEGIEALLGDPLTPAVGVPLIVAFLGSIARFFARHEGGPRWSDAYVGVDLSLAALSGEIVAITQRSNLAPAEPGDVMGPYILFTVFVFLCVVALHRTAGHWDHHPFWRGILRLGLANASGFGILLGFVLIVEF